MSPAARVVDSYRYLNPASTMLVKSLIARAPRDPLVWTPLRRPLEAATVALVSTAGISLQTDPPFDGEGERRNPWWGDPSHRVIPRSTTARDVVVGHLHVDGRYILEDLNVALPLERLADLERSGRIGRVAPSHYSFMGYLLDPSEFLAATVPAMIARMRDEGVDAAVFLPV